jgi:hypothetical protein
LFTRATQLGLFVFDFESSSSFHHVVIPRAEELTSIRSSLGP